MLIRFNLLKMDVLADPRASLGVNSGSFPHISDCSFQERLCSMKIVGNKFLCLVNEFDRPRDVHICAYWNYHLFLSLI
jgi:hypothetical protein